MADHAISIQFLSWFRIFQFLPSEEFDKGQNAYWSEINNRNSDNRFIKLSDWVVWCDRPVIPDTLETEAGGLKIQSLPELQSDVKVSQDKLMGSFCKERENGAYQG